MTYVELDTIKDNNYDFIIVGCGLYGAVCANLLTESGKKCLVIEKRNHIAGNLYTEKIENINVHKYGAHIFHTSKKEVWEYVNKFCEFNNFVNSPIANYKGELYNLPFNMNTFNKMWGVITPKEAMEKIQQQKEQYAVEQPSNLEEQAINLVGKEIYEKLIKGYTEKQWGRDCTELPSFIINRLPLRFTYDNNYFEDTYQGIPKNSYTSMIESMLENVDVVLNIDYLNDKEKWNNIADTVIYTGPVDSYFDNCYGKLEYRSVKFVEEIKDTDNYQGVAVVNYTDRETPYTRVIEHKHFEKSVSEKTVVSYEYSDVSDDKQEPYYPINDNKNNELYKKYYDLTKQQNKVVFGGRLGEYKYYNMDIVVERAFEVVSKLIKK